MTYTVGSLFAGIGGFDLGFERAGFKTAWQVEIDPYCQKVLAKNFPEAERFGDIRECGSHNLKPVDVICGGFPCQDISNAGLRVGIEGERSGLWKHYARIISELRPKYVLVENVAALLGRGMGVVLGDLATIGYDAEWEVLSAADVGAPHLRERIWVLAYPSSERFSEEGELRSDKPTQRLAGCGETSNSNSFHGGSRWSRGSSGGSENRESKRTQALADPNILTMVRSSIARRECNPWHPEPQVGRVVDGVPVQLVADELRSLGNAVVPQIPEMIARRIKQALETP
jgi:DNA (cytosine-5)-methyltransferase 1